MFMTPLILVPLRKRGDNFVLRKHRLFPFLFSDSVEIVFYARSIVFIQDAVGRMAKYYLTITIMYTDGLDV